MDECPFHKIKLNYAIENCHTQNTDKYLVNLSSQAAYEGIKTDDNYSESILSVLELIRYHWDNGGLGLITELNSNVYKAVKILPVSDTFDNNERVLTSNNPVILIEEASQFLKSIFLTGKAIKPPLLTILFNDCTPILNSIAKDIFSSSLNEKYCFYDQNTSHLFSRYDWADIIDNWFYSEYIDNCLIETHPDQEAYSAYSEKVSNVTKAILNLFNSGSIKASKDNPMIHKLAIALALHHIVGTRDLYELCTKYFLYHDTKRGYKYGLKPKSLNSVANKDITGREGDIYIYLQIYQRLTELITASIENELNKEETFDSGKLLNNLQIRTPLYIICATDTQYEIFEFGETKIEFK